MLVWPLPSMLVLSGLAVAMTLVDVAVHPLMRSRLWPKKRGAAVADVEAVSERTDASP